MRDRTRSFGDHVRGDTSKGKDRLTKPVWVPLGPSVSNRNVLDNSWTQGFTDGPRVEEKVCSRRRDIIIDSFCIYDNTNRVTHHVNKQSSHINGIDYYG